MTMKKIVGKNGPLNGKTINVPEAAQTFTHHADTAGHYKVNEKTATWQDGKTPIAPKADA